jgi:hypothetical protein
VTTPANLQRWTALHASALVDVLDAGADVLEQMPGTAECAEALNHTNACCAALERLTRSCQGEIQARYAESREVGEAHPADAQEAVLHLRGLRDLTQAIMRNVKGSARHWHAGTWAKFDKTVKVHEFNKGNAQ